MKHTALLALADGTLFWGQSIGATGESVGEVVFNTAMTGYQEILTDPSYSKQLVTLTYPHIGNTGTNAEDVESNSVCAAGLIIRDLPRLANNWRNTQNLDDYLIENSVVAIADIDTRHLTRILREKGAQNGCIVTGDNIDSAQAVAAAQAFPGLKGMDLAKQVTTAVPYSWQQSVWSLADGYSDKTDGTYKVVAYDFGVKRNILRILVDLGCDVQVVPAQTSAQDVLAMNPDGVFLSNGPGDPEPCDYAIKAVQEIIAAGKPIFGICLGHQILALASGAATEKMKFGHHGANHPVQDLDTKKVMITSQNHGFAVDEATMPDNLRVTHRSLFDNTIQGIERVDVPAFSFQGHPEASPGPRDVAPLFERFIQMMQTSATSVRGEK
ncbi:glutamine-hydrolyzing carbamoyl-phosphate synthase small subunit [Arenicella xantha]|uniref:Carbamoyl phosphate synthase small chain n=1 Tax=Arenicella xantha TaxID=644221 RepID=A0A395JLI8_9GAMM|nr:glutamine-hydrolyzing carbamoyl-phosphate synthase small subunit [Arenicella xantha]RBP51469.1 carbamoyl-phosphate synthase small subunit [Arenicella xantha]